MKIHYQEKSETLISEAAETFKNITNSLRQKKDRAVWGLCGGRSVGELFKVLASDRDFSWEKVELFMVDERMVPRGHPDLNFNLVEKNLTEPLIQAGKLKHSQVHFFDATLPSAAKTYTQILNEFGGKLDALILSSGEDAHIAAVFPGHPSIEYTGEGFFDFHHSPKAPEHRMSASPSLIQKASAALFFIQGEAKREAFQKFLNPKLTFRECPAKLTSAITELHLFTDLKE
jgi:6-phosphogluconolactonase